MGTLIGATREADAAQGTGNKLRWEDDGLSGITESEGL